MALLPRRWEREVFATSFGFVVGSMIDPRLKGRLSPGMILSPAVAFVANGCIRRFADASGAVPFGTDAGPLGASGVPCVVFGPGDIAQAHTKDEWIELDQVDQAALAYYQIALELGR